MPTSGDAVTYSRHLGAIGPDQFQAALTRFGLGTLLRTEPIRGGITGQNCFVTSTADAYVLRGRPLWPGQFEEERFLAGQISRHTQVTAPWPYLVDAATDIFGWSYALMPRLPGTPLPWPESWEARPAGTRLEVARALGEGLVMLQELRWPHPGRFDAATGAVIPFEISVGERLTGQVRAGLASARACTPDRVGAADEAYVEAILRRAAPALQEPTDARFVMPDYKEDNVLVEVGPQGCRVCGVVDLGGHFGDGAQALVRQRAMYLASDPAVAAAFVGAYLTAFPPRPGFAERLAAYALNERLEIWGWAHRSGVAWWDPGLSLRAWLAPFVESTWESA